ncbi:MAG: hypothetical protein CSB55_08640 [Candidatus Cloacimonadota bacterium]|nr:MAG: hypothetical protein CSB55_08640 [Candidatus Cloacimonadota bacterium]
MLDFDNLKLVVIGNLHYPQGAASTNRIHAYLKGIKQNGFDSLVICTGIPFREKVNFEASGSYEGINYLYSSGNHYRDSRFIMRNLNKIFAFWKSIIILVKLKKNNKNFAILEYSTSFIDEVVLFIICKWLKIPVIRESNELPDVIIYNRKNIIEKFISLVVRPKLYDGVIVISKFLEVFFADKIRKNAKSLFIPILVDFDRFNCILEESEEKYIAYCGFMGGNKDGVDFLIKSYAKSQLYKQNIKLYLIGYGPEEDIKRLKKISENFLISDYVNFIGKVDRDDMPKYLKNSVALVLARPNSKQAEAGFPTKLGEYLATGKPVIVTDVGEISSFLKDNESAFIAVPNNIDDFSDKLIKMNDNYSKSLLIGEAGKKTALNNFQINSNSKKLLEFIENILG